MILLRIDWPSGLNVSRHRDFRCMLAGFAECAEVFVHPVDQCPETALKTKLASDQAEGFDPSNVSWVRSKGEGGPYQHHE